MFSPNVDGGRMPARQLMSASIQRTAAQWRVSSGLPQCVVFPPEPLGTRGSSHDLPLPFGRPESPVYHPHCGP